MRSLTPLVWLVAGLICFGGTDAYAKEKKVDWSEYLEPKGGSRTKLVRTSAEPAPKATKATKAKAKAKKKKVAAKKAKGKKKRNARR